MTTTEIIWTIVIAIAALVLIALVVAAMRKKSQEADHAHAAQLREQADTRASAIPDAETRAQEAELAAEQARVRAEKEARQARMAKDDLLQQEAEHEDQIRAADRLDPTVDHRADDYSPEVRDPANPSTTGAGGTASTGTTEDGSLRDGLDGDQSEGRHRT